MVLFVCPVFANDGPTQGELQEKLNRIQAEFNYGKIMMEKSQLEYQIVQSQLQALQSKPTVTINKKR